MAPNNIQQEDRVMLTSFVIVLKSVGYELR